MDPPLRNVSLALWAMLAVLYAWPLDLDVGPNVTAHVDQAFAIVSGGTLAIDAFMMPRPNTIDWSRAPDGRYYPAKAPGAALLAVPVTWVLHHIERQAGVDPLATPWFGRNLIVVNWVMNPAMSAGAMVLLFFLALSLDIPPRPALVGTLAIAIGTAYYPYSTTYYAHVPAANAIIAATFLIFLRNPRTETDAAAGLLSGAAVLFDYPAALAAITLALGLCILRPRALLSYIAAATVPLAALMWYHTAAFGNPFSTAYTYQNPRFTGNDGSFISMPNLRVLGRILVGPYRGIFIYSPAVALALAGAGRVMKDDPVNLGAQQRRKLFATVAIVMLLIWLIVNASYRTWWGGFTAGPRFVIPGLVLLGPLIAIGFQRFSRFGALLIAVSILNYVAITAVVVMLKSGVINPLGDAIYPRLMRGEFSRSNIGLRLGIHGLWSILPPMVFGLACFAAAWKWSGRVRRYD